MCKIKTLKVLLKEHPEWANLPIGVYRSDGNIDFVGRSGSVFISEYDKEHILVFSGN